MKPQPSSEELLRRIEHRDRRFRRAETLFFTLIAVVLSVVVVGQYAQLTKLKQQSSERQTGIARILKANQDETARQTRYIQCIAQFFAQADRANTVLTDLDKCNFEKNGQAVPGVDLTPTRSLQSTAAPGTTMVTPQPSIDDLYTTSAQPVDNSQAPVVVTPAPFGVNNVHLGVIPAPILDLTLCVDLLQLCIDN